MNTMWFKLRKENEDAARQVTASDETLEILMKLLFYDDDYVFMFNMKPDFEIFSEWKQLS